MKPTNLFLMGVLAFGLSTAGVLKASAQYGTTPQPQPEEPAAETAKPTTDAQARIAEALKEFLPDAAIGSAAKGKAVGTNHVYNVQFTSKGKKMIGQVVDDGTVLETEEPGDIQSFPAGASGAVRKAITQVGVRDNGVRIGHTYAEIQKDAAGEDTVVKLSAPVTTYRADVQNSKGVKGKYSFTADGALLEKPDWATQ